MRRITPWLVVAGFSALGGCSGDANHTSLFQTMDSAGVRVVTADAMRPHHLGAPALEVGGADGSTEATFGYVVDGLLLPEGRVAIADAMASTIRVFDSAGRHQDDWGGAGAGPGEFQALWTLQRYRGDSVMAGESGARRLSVLDSRGRLGRLIRPSPRLATPSGYVQESSCCVLRGTWLDGSVLVTTAELMPVHTAEVQTGLVLGVRLDAGGTATGENPVPFKSGRYVPNPPGGPQSSQAFHYDMAASATPLGEGYVAVHGSSYEVRYLNAEGVLTGVSRVTRAREPVTEKIHEELEAYYRARAARAGGNVEASGLSWVMSRPFPDSLPAYNTVLVDPEGRVWAGYVASSLHERASTFDVFRSSGEFIGALDLPVGARLLDVAGVHVLIVVTDELGVQRVQVVPMPVALRPSV